MKKKLLIFIGLIFVLLFNVSLLSRAEDREKTIIYIYSLTNHLSESILDELEDNGININSIDVTKLGNMKDYYRYNTAYNIDIEHQELPVIFSGDSYFSGDDEEITNSLEDIIQNASTPLKDIKNIDIKMIVNLYSPDNPLSDSIITELRSRGINITSIDVTKFDYMKYLYLTNAAFDIEEENQKLPIVLSGDSYFSGNEEINSSLQDIDENSENELKDISQIDIKMIVYFYSPFCTGCKEVNPKIQKLIDDKKIKVVKVDVSHLENSDLFYSYSKSYNVTDDITTPMVFSGSKYYHSAKTISSSLKEIVNNASSLALNDIHLAERDLEKYEGFFGFILILFAGLLDGVNPCAMAMLILFISLLVGLSSKKSTLISVSVAYILGLFVTYFLLGAFLIHTFEKFEPYIQNLTFYINIFIIALSIFLFFFNLHDYFVSKNEEFGKIKNQLPKGIQKFNKKLIKIFTKSLNDKNIVIVYMISFILGVVISLTEFLCTGQVYLPTILIIAQTGGLSGLIKLFFYNIMFVLPLIVLAILAIKTQSTMETSNKIREKLYLIKLVTSIFFLVIAVYYILKVFGVI
ncbi:hypothetical protein KHQ81_11105 [Mycoplasmatota bacterium]|nr:hypothetical protein KHQ81_11105 [Mycoplasmatota bacterium]